MVFFVIYVDDLLLKSSCDKQVKLVAEQIGAKFKFHICDEKLKVPGIVIENIHNGILIDNSGAVEKHLRHFGMERSSSISTLLPFGYGAQSFSGELLSDVESYQK